MVDRLISERPRAINDAARWELDRDMFRREVEALADAYERPHIAPSPRQRRVPCWIDTGLPDDPLLVPIGMRHLRNDDEDGAA